LDARMVRSATKQLGGVAAYHLTHSNTTHQEPIVQSSFPTRPRIPLRAPGQPTLALQVQYPPHRKDAGTDVLYLHGSTFGADMSIFYRLDGHSWADALNDAGLSVWGFDWAGYGHSERYPQGVTTPVGRMADVLPQLRRVVGAIRARNSDRPIALIAHSWGGGVAAAYAALYPQDVKALVLFGPITPRTPTGNTAPPAAPAASHYTVSLWAQYRRFVEDVPRGQPQVLSEAHFQAWGEAYLATDPTARTRTPPSVWTPTGPSADVQAWWSGDWMYAPACVKAPTLVVRGEWDSLCTDADAKTLLDALGSTDKRDCKIARATHLMHLEAQREVLYRHTNEFLQFTTSTTTTQEFT
jgi:alpha-beta hydrolase superfamily lysophospholipase